MTYQSKKVVRASPQEKEIIDRARVFAKAIVNLSDSPDVSQQHELLKAFQTIKSKDKTIDLRNLTDKEIDEFIETFNCG